MRLYAQLNFGGNCEEAFRFYEQHLGGKIGDVMVDHSRTTQNRTTWARSSRHA